MRKPAVGTLIWLLGIRVALSDICRLHRLQPAYSLAGIMGSVELPFTPAPQLPMRPASPWWEVCLRARAIYELATLAPGISTASGLWR